MNALERQALRHWALFIVIGVLGLAAEVTCIVTLDLTAGPLAAIVFVCALTFVQAWRAAAARR